MNAEADDFAHEKGTMIRDERYKYVMRLSGTDEFYDLQKAPKGIPERGQDPEVDQCHRVSESPDPSSCHPAKDGHGQTAGTVDSRKSASCTPGQYRRLPETGVLPDQGDR